MTLLPHLLTLALLVPADWPHLRGPNHDGVSGETGLADAWPAEGPPRLWSLDLGQGHSGFIVVDGRLYTQRQTLTSQFLLCLDPTTGEKIWETRYDWSWHPRGAYPGPYATPTAYQGNIFVTSPTGRVVGIDARTGARRWSINVREKFNGEGYGFGYAAAPTLDDGRLILPVGGPDASLVALDPATGETLWTSGSDPASYCPAVPITVAGRRCIVGYLQNSWVIVDAATGKQLHRQALSSGYDEHSAWPIYREPHLLLTAPFRAPAVRHRLSWNPDGSLVVQPDWTSRELSNDVASSVLVGDHVYGFDLKALQSSKYRASRGEFRCLDWATGKSVWSTAEVGQACVLAADGKLFLLNDTGTLILADADPKGYRERGRVQLFDEEICWTPPTLWQGRLFVRSPSRAVCLWVGKGEELSLDTPMLAAPPRSWHLDPAWLVSHEREYPNDAPTLSEMTAWFLASLALLALAGLIALPFPGRGVTFLSLALVLPLFGPNLLSTALDRLLFTWPATLYAAFHGMLAITHRARQTGAAWRARLTVVCFLLVCYAYFEACRAVGLFLAWAFLAGFLPAFPLTWLAVRAAGMHRWLWATGWTLLAFAVFFWSGQGLVWWKGM